MTEQDPKKPPTHEQSWKETAERQQRELEEDDEPKTDADKALAELKHQDEPMTTEYDER